MLCFFISQQIVRPFNLKIFFLQDVELDAVDSNNKTPLRLAMGRDYKEIVYYLQGKLNRFVSCRLRCVLFTTFSKDGVGIAWLTCFITDMFTCLCLFWCGHGIQLHVLYNH